MADSKLTGLSAISQANVDDTALLYIVDVTGGNVSRKVTKGNLFAGTKTTQLVIGLPTGPTGSANVFYGGVKIPAATVTFATTAQTNDYYTNFLDQATLVNPSSGTVPNAATLKIVGAPIASTNVTITNAYALWVAGGTTKLDGSISATGLLTSTGGITMSSADITLAGNKIKTTNFTISEKTTGLYGGVQINNQLTNQVTTLGIAPTGTSTGSGLVISRTSDYTTNYETIEFMSDLIVVGEFATNIIKNGTGSLRPWQIYMNGTKLLSFDTGNTVTIYSDLIMSAGSSNAIVTNDLIFAATGAGQPGTLIQRNGAGGQMLSLVSGTTTNAGLQIFRTTDYTTNYSGLRLDIDYSNSAAWTLGPFKGGSGSLFPMYFQMGSGTNIIGIQTSGKISFFNQLDTYNNISTAGMGVVPVYGSTKQKSETGADTNVLTLTPPAVAGSYRIKISVDVSAASVATFGWTATWKDSNGTSQAPTNLAFDKAGSATLNLTVTAAANDHYTADMYIDIDNSATNIVIKTTFSGTSIAYKISASIEQIQ